MFSWQQFRLIYIDLISPILKHFRKPFIIQEIFHDENWPISAAWRLRGLGLSEINQSRE